MLRVQAFDSEPTTGGDHALFRALFDHSPEPQLLFEPQAQLPIEFNQALLKLLRVGREEFARTPLHALVSSADRIAFDADLARVLASGRHDFGCSVRRSDGQWLDLQVRAVVFDVQGRTSVHATLHDRTEEHRAGQVLRDRDVQLRLALDVARLSMYEWDVASGTITSYHYGVAEPQSAAAQITYEQFVSRIHPQDRARVLASVERTIATGAQYREVYRYTGADAIERWLISQAGVQHDVDGKVVRLSGASIDVSELYRTQAALTESERRFERMADLAPVLMWVANPDGSCNYFNETWLRFTGLTLAQASGWGWLDCLHPADAGRWQSIRMQGDRGAPERGAFRVEYRLRRADGQYRWIDAQGSPRYDADGAFLGFVGCGVDVTERAEAEVEIAEWKARYDAAARASGQVLYDWDLVGNEIIWSSSTQDVFGYPPAQLRTREQWTEKVHAEDRHRVERSLDDFLVGEEPEPVSYRVVRADGSLVMIEVRRLGLRGTHGRVDRVIGFLSDITERRRLEREVIEVANREQVRIGNDLHDGLGQELTGIALLLKSISSQARLASPPLAADLATVTDLVSHAVASCRSLAQGVSAYALERGGLETALMELAQTSRNVFGFECTVGCARGVSARLNEQQAYQLYRIAQEAVSNAAKHSGGRRVNVRLEATDARIRLVVSDDGAGMKAVTSATTGMGLRTMRYRASNIGAQLKVDGVPAGGTRVTCSLKLDDRAGEEPRVPARRKSK